MSVVLLLFQLSNETDLQASAGGIGCGEHPVGSAVDAIQKRRENETWKQTKVEDFFDSVLTR